MVDEVFAVRTHGFIIYLHKDGINFLVTLSQLKKKGDNCIIWILYNI